MFFGDGVLAILCGLLLVSLFLIQMEKKSHVRSLALSHSYVKWRVIFLGVHILSPLMAVGFVCMLQYDPFSVWPLKITRSFSGPVHTMSLQAVVGLLSLTALMLLFRVREMCRIRRKYLPKDAFLDGRSSET